MHRSPVVPPASPVVPASASSAEALPGWDALGLLPSIRRAIVEEGYPTPTPIQREAIPHVLAGRDVLGVAQTGTGKTAAFAMPILQRLVELGRRQGTDPRVLVLSPTRELASQIGDSFANYGRHTGISRFVIFGGVGERPQIDRLRQGVDVLVATPGRLLDFLQQGILRLDRLPILVLDEADRMLDMGFLPDVRRIVNACGKPRQTLFFSATMPDDIVALAKSMLVSPVRVEVTPVSSTAERIVQSVYMVERADKRRMLELVLRDPSIARALVFTRTKHGANRVAEQLTKAGIASAAIHGNKSQNARERALAGFRDGSLRIMVATDIAARGIDIDGITHVVNFELPEVAETYVHRIGRTARAGAEGVAFSFCDTEERPLLAAIERLIRQRIPRVEMDGFQPSPPGAREPEDDRGPRPQRGGRPQHRRDDRGFGGGQGGGAQARSAGGGGGRGASFGGASHTGGARSGGSQGPSSGGHGGHRPSGAGARDGGPRGGGSMPRGGGPSRGR